MTNLLPDLSKNNTYPWLNYGLDGAKTAFTDFKNTLVSNMQYDSSSSGTFNTSSRPSGIANVPSQDQSWINQIAANVFGLSLQRVASHNFNQTVKNNITDLYHQQMASIGAYNYFTDVFNQKSGVNSSQAIASINYVIGVVTSTTWINNINMAISRAAITNSDYQLQLVLWKILYYYKYYGNDENSGQEKLNTVKQKWKDFKLGNPSKLDEVNISWLGSKISQTVVNQIDYSVFFGNVQTACNVEDTDTQPVTGGGTYGGTWFYYTYGAKVTSWVQSTGNSYGIYSGQGPDNKNSHFEGPFGCFGKGTKL